MSHIVWDFILGCLSWAVVIPRRGTFCSRLSASSTIFNVVGSFLLTQVAVTIAWSVAVDAFWYICLPGLPLQHPTCQSMHSLVFSMPLQLALPAAPIPSGSVSWLRLHDVWDQEQLNKHCFSLSLGFLGLIFFWGGGGLVGEEVGICFGVFCLWFFLVLLCSSFQAALLVMCLFSFIVVLISYTSGNLYIGDLFEDILTLLNKFSEKPGQCSRLVWLSPLQSLACLGLLCFHFPRGWISDVLWNPQSRIQMFKWQKPVLRNPNAQGYFFWQDPGTQAVILICWPSAFH